MHRLVRRLLLVGSWLLAACQGRFLQQHGGRTPWVCPGLDDAKVLCQRDGYSVLAPADPSKNVRILRLGKACAVETQITCAGPRPPRSDQCQGNCGPCPCEYNNGTISGLRYLQTMVDQLQPVCAAAQPTRVLMIGLGGGLSTHHVLSHCPSMTVDAVDYSPAVIDLATRFFGIGEAKARYQGRLQVEEADALHAVSTKPSASYDAVLVDCFVGAGVIPDNCRSQPFAEGVRRILKPGGVMMQNMWVWSPSVPTVAAQFSQALKTYQQVFHRDAVADLHVPMPPHLDFVRVVKCTATPGAVR